MIDTAMLILGLRKTNNMTQGELAKKSGISQSMISLYETGRVSPSIYSLEAMLNACGLELAVKRRK